MAWAGGGALLLVLLVVASKVSKPSTAKTKKTPAPISYTETEYAKDSKAWRAIVVPRGTNDQKLCELARWLHKEQWLAHFHFFDDGRRVGEFVSWTQSYPVSRRSKELVDWMRVHHRGIATGPRGGFAFDGLNVDAANDASYSCSCPD